MNKLKRQVRNASDKLICEMCFDGVNWIVEIKRGGCRTALFLYPGGDFRVANESAAEAAATQNGLK